MKKIAAILLLGIFFWSTAPLMAHEHAGKEHGGSETSAPAAAPSKESEEVKTLKEAAAALKATHPDLAAKLEKLAKEEDAE